MSGPVQFCEGVKKKITQPFLCEIEEKQQTAGLCILSNDKIN